jgi:hypothetical protein
MVAAFRAAAELGAAGAREVHKQGNPACKGAHTQAGVDAVVSTW